MYKIGEDILLETSKDGLIGYMTILQDDFSDEPQSIKDIMEKIKEYFKYGLQEELVNRFLSTKLVGEKLNIAEGKPAEKGIDGDIKVYFEKDKPLLPKIKEDGTVDYRELDSINKVVRDEVLAEIIPPTNGVDGIKVTGEIISTTKGRTPKFRVGKNTRISADGKKLLSTINGLVDLNSSKISVIEVLNIKNLDHSTGNISFDGNVIVEKDVLNGFVLRAGGSVEIKGALEGGYVESFGDVLIRQGIQGYNKQVILTRGNLSAKFIENSIVSADLNITSEAIMHSNVSSKSNILVLGKKGLIVGGVVKAKYEIRAKIIGSTMATTTVLEVGTDPDIKLKYEELNDKIKASKDNLEKIIKSIRVIETLKKANKIDSKKEDLYQELSKAEIQLKLEIVKMEEEFAQVKQNISSLSRGMVKVSDTIYPGVKIVIGNSFMYVRDEMKRCTFYKDGADIRVGPY